ncbi:hypothetical protein HaLaN_07103, partial [Haematococcus lacustris]
MAKKERKGSEKKGSGKKSKRAGPWLTVSAVTYAATRPHRQQYQSQGPALPRLPGVASAPRLSRQLSLPSAPRLSKPSQHHSQAGGAHWSFAGGQIRQLCQPRARGTHAWATRGCETSLPRPRSSSSLLRHSSVGPLLELSSAYNQCMQVMPTLHNSPQGSGNDVGGRHSCTMSICTGFTPHSPITPFESGHYCPVV